jgi:hypothetical protein
MRTVGAGRAVTWRSDTGDAEERARRWSRVRCPRPAPSLSIAPPKPLPLPGNRPCTPIAPAAGEPFPLPLGMRGCGDGGTLARRETGWLGGSEEACACQSLRACALRRPEPAHAEADWREQRTGAQTLGADTGSRHWEPHGAPFPEPPRVVRSGASLMAPSAGTLPPVPPALGPPRPSARRALPAPPLRPMGLCSQGRCDRCGGVGGQ